MSWKHSLIALAASAALVSTGTGCASGSWGIPVPSFVGSWMGKKDDATAAKPTNIAAAKASTKNDEPNAFEKMGHSIADSSVGRGVASTYHKTSTSIAKTFHPKKTEAPDPTSLAKPAKAGPEVYVAIARLQEKNGNTAEAIAAYEHALELDPKFLSAQLGLARLYDRDGKLELATAKYLETIKAHPQEAGAMNDLGFCYARQEKYDESLVYLRRAIDVEPEKPLYRNNLAAVLVEVGRLDEAIAQLEAVHGKAIAHYNVAVLLQARGQRDLAIEHFKKATDADPTLQPAQDWLASLEEAKAKGTASTHVADRRAAVAHSGPDGKTEPSAGAAASPTVVPTAINDGTVLRR
ncbi:MAG TPA: tetratricopeptide repeat protein [Pirellulales bacterium]|nr:tetratricopeptide repeat protein [Pirellulales bacterium]